MPAFLIQAAVAALRILAEKVVETLARKLAQQAISKAAARLTQGFKGDRLKGNLIAWSGDFTPLDSDEMFESEEDLDSLDQYGDPELDETEEMYSDYDESAVMVDLTEQDLDVSNLEEYDFVEESHLHLPDLLENNLDTLEHIQPYPTVSTLEPNNFSLSELDE